MDACQAVLSWENSRPNSRLDNQTSQLSRSNVFKYLKPALDSELTSSPDLAADQK